MALPSRKYDAAGGGGGQRNPLALRSRFNSNVAEINLTGKRGRSKQPPPEVTHAENFYYLKQMNSRTPMVVVLTDGEQVHGCIEWYDRTCLKINRDGSPNLVIQKHCIKYIYKQSEQNGDE